MSLYLGQPQNIFYELTCLVMLRMWSVFIEYSKEKEKREKERQKETLMLKT